VTAPGPRTADRHRANPIPFRPPAGEREWLTSYAERTGRAVNAILADALRLYRERAERKDAEHEPSPPA
jgi:hypothetical protein